VSRQGHTDVDVCIGVRRLPQMTNGVELCALLKCCEPPWARVRDVDPFVARRVPYRGHPRVADLQAQAIPRLNGRCDIKCDGHQMAGIAFKFVGAVIRGRHRIRRRRTTMA